MALYRRGNTWYYLFYVNSRRYRGSTGTGNEKEAGKIMSRKMSAAEAGELLRPQKIPLLRDYIVQFEEWVKTINRAPKTRTDYHNGCRLILGTDLAAMRLDRVTAGDIEATGFHESPYSTNCALRTLRRALRRAHEQELVRRVPKIKLMDAPRREVMIGESDEARLLKAILHADAQRRYKKKDPAPLLEVLTIMLDCGLRPSEVVAMRRENFNLGDAFYWNPKGKTRKARRRVPLSERVLVIVRERLQGDQKAGWVFPSALAKSGHVELRAIQRKFRKIARDLGITDELKVYCARHTFGTVTMAEARDPALVMEGMGHEDLRTTMGYMHPDTGRLKEIIDRRNESKLVQ